MKQKKQKVKGPIRNLRPRIQPIIFNTFLVEGKAHALPIDYAAEPLETPESAGVAVVDDEESGWVPPKRHARATRNHVAV